MPYSPEVFTMSLLATLNLVTEVCLGISAKVSVGELIPALWRGPYIATSERSFGRSSDGALSFPS